MDGIGDQGLPTVVLAVVLSVFLARGLFEVGVLWGGADAKAVMAAGLVLPLAPVALFSGVEGSSASLAALPFGWVLVMNGALLSIAIPIAIALRNVARGTFEVPRGLYQYPIPVATLPDRFVWVKDPFLDRTVEEADSSEDDHALPGAPAGGASGPGHHHGLGDPADPVRRAPLAGAVATFLVGNLIFAILSAL